MSTARFKPVFKSSFKIKNLRRSMKDNLGFCMCARGIPNSLLGACNIGQTGRPVLDRCREHGQYSSLKQKEKSVFAEHCRAGSHHKALFVFTSVLVQVENYWERLIHESVEISLDQSLVN